MGLKCVPADNVRTAVVYSHEFCLDIKYCEKVYERSGINLFWSIKKSGDFLDKLKLEISMHLSISNDIVSTKIYDKLDVLKEPSREKALLTLHLMTEMHFLLR